MKRDADDKLGLERERLHAEIRRQIVADREILANTWQLRENTAKQVFLWLFSSYHHH
jgi:hypothetical protein